jgi:hypothetical protein
MPQMEKPEEEEPGHVPRGRSGLEKAAGTPLPRCGSPGTALSLFVRHLSVTFSNPLQIWMSTEEEEDGEPVSSKSADHLHFLQTLAERVRGM